MPPTSVFRHRAKRPAATPRPHPPRRTAAEVIWALTRISLGLGYLWTFLDLTFGLGWHVPPERAWITGNSPVRWSLYTLDGPVASLLHSASGHPVADLLLMVLIALLAVTLTPGFALWPAAVGNALLMGLSWLARFPDPAATLIDAQLVFALLGFGLAAVHAGEVWGLGRLWRRSPLVRRLPWLR